MNILSMIFLAIGNQHHERPETKVQSLVCLNHPIVGPEFPVMIVKQEEYLIKLKLMFKTKALSTKSELVIS